MNYFRFANWPVYADAKDLFKEITAITKSLPNEYKYSICDQVTRSCLSIVLNIAEGSGKDSDKELNRYFNIAIGSVNETFAILDIMQEANLLRQKDFDLLNERCTNIAKQLGGFKKRLRYNFNSKSLIVNR